MSAFSHCAECGRKLRDAVFCPGCRSVFCSWKCQLLHSKREATSAVSGTSVACQSATKPLELPVPGTVAGLPVPPG